MPTSKLELIQPIVHLIWQHRQRLDEGQRWRVLDVGAGFGKYGLLIREAVDPGAELTALDVYPQATLIGIYDNVAAADVRDWPVDAFDGYDLVLLIDVLEHVSLVEGRKLLQSVWAPMIVSTPSRLFATPAEAPELPPWEQHQCLWRIRDLEVAVAPRPVVWLANRYDQLVADVAAAAVA